MNNFSVYAGYLLRRNQNRSVVGRKVSFRDVLAPFRWSYLLLLTWTWTSSASIVSLAIARLQSIFLKAPPKTACNKNVSNGALLQKCSSSCKAMLRLSARP